SIGSGTGGFQFADLYADLFERFGYWANQIGDRLATKVQIASSGLLHTFQSRFGEVEKCLIIVLQGIGGEGFKGVSQFLTGIILGGLQVFILQFLVLKAFIQDRTLGGPL